MQGVFNWFRTHFDPNIHNCHRTQPRLMSAPRYALR